jgi:glycosyltransferase involved in cell wall biosynthesis
MGFDTSKQPLCIAVVFKGNIERDFITQIKYGYLVNALERRFETVKVYDANLHGIMRSVNALKSFNIHRDYWRQSFRKNNFAFKARSRHVAAALKANADETDVVLQVGVLFDAHWQASTPPTVIYTDYTAQLSSQKPETGRSPLSPNQLNQWLQLERQAYERTTHICSRSELVRTSIINDYHISPDRVTVVGGGVNFETFPESIVRTPHSAPTVLFIGQKFFRKGGDLVLRAFAQVRIQLPQARLLFLTEDPVPRELPLDGVELFSFAWDRKLVEKLYRRADLLVLPSRLETWGDVLLEAMAYKLPCIGVYGESMEEIIINHKTGLLVPPKDTDSLATAMVTLLGNLPLAYELGQTARERVEQYFTWDKVIEKIAPFLIAAARNHL